MRISVVVISKDEPELDKTLDELERQCARGGHEIVVIDASRGRLDWIRDSHPGVIWRNYQPPIGRSSSIPQQRNVGVGVASGEIIVFCDSGGIPVEGWLESLVKPIEEGRYAYTCGPVTSRREGVYRTINDVADGEIVEGPPTANVAISRKLFDAVGGFDERYAYGSDVDIAWRCAKFGSAPRNVKAAVMTMDWGAWELQKKRSWRYGRARARLARFHQAHGRILRKQPEILAYPGAGVGLVLGGAYIGTRGGKLVFGAGAALAAVLVGRNRKTPKARQVMLGHIIYGWAYIFEHLFGPRGGKRTVVVHTPQDDGPYVRNLVTALNEAGVGAAVLSGATKSQTVNLILQPLMLVKMRLGGARIMHLHWMWGHDLAWARNRWAKRVLRWWFGFNLEIAKRCGIKIIWTAHNLYPHEAVFDDDKAARARLIEACDGVVVHNEQAAERVREVLGAHNIKIIDQGYIEHDGGGREAARRKLGIGEDRTVVLGFGKIMRYKGFETMLAAGLHVSPELAERLTIRLVGACADKQLQGDLETLAKGVRAVGVEVFLDFQHVEDERLGNEIDAADMCVYMFTENLNSSSIRAAQRSGRIAVIGSGVLRPDGGGCIEGGDTAESCAKSIEHVAGLGLEERLELEAEAQESAQRTWRECAEETGNFYREVLTKKKSPRSGPQRH